MSTRTTFHHFVETSNLLLGNRQNLLWVPWPTSSFLFLFDDMLRILILPWVY